MVENLDKRENHSFDYLMMYVRFPGLVHPVEC